MNPVSSSAPLEPPTASTLCQERCFERRRGVGAVDRSKECSMLESNKDVSKRSDGFFNGPLPVRRRSR